MLAAISAVLLCIRHEHEPWLMLVAGLVCAAGVYAAFAIASHAIRSTGRRRLGWGLVSVLASGCTAWATHFMVLLAFKPHMPAAFDPLLTAVSLGCALAGMGVGVALAISGRRRTGPQFAAGLVVGCGIALLHYVGQEAYLVTGRVSWNLPLVLASIVISLPLSGVALVAAVQRNRRVRRCAAPLLLLSIAILHFCGMAAMTLRYDPMVSLPDGAVTPAEITPIVAGVSIALIALGVLGWRFELAAIARLRNDRRRLQELADVALEGLLIAKNGVIVTANNSIKCLSGYRQEQLTGGLVATLLPSIDIASLPEKEEREAELVGADGQHIPVRVLRSEMALGHKWQTVIAVRDQRERLRTEAKMRTLAFGDALTGLPNRTRFYDLLKARSGSCRTGGQRFAVLVVDLDRFKPVNDTLGHAAGDVVLREVGERLREAVREEDVVARLGGDEFAILQMGADSADEAAALAARIVVTIGRVPFVLDGNMAQVGASVGIAWAPADGDDPAVLMRNADLALYAAKAEGKGTYCRYDPILDERARARQAMEAGLRRALDADEMELHYQPLLDARTGTITSAEALVRWRHPDRGLVPPAEFIPLAEETGLIQPLGEWVLRTACAEAATWPEHITVAVNISPAQFRERTLSRAVLAALEGAGLAPHRLELEITEGVLLTDEKSTLKTLEQLRGFGVRISMDDFGTGYSSLSYLRRFPFDKIKIDQSFVRQAPADPESVAIVRAIITMGACLGMTTTVEGVETAEQFAFSVAEGCDHVQGYHVSRPLPRDAFTALLEQGDARESDAA